MVPPGCRLDLVSPAKINLSLAILGRQPDGFHSLHSIVAQTRFGDPVTIQWAPDSPEPDEILFKHRDLPSADNTLIQAIREFRSAADYWNGQFLVTIDKKIPIGSGLGGGSSNAVTVLSAIRQIFGESFKDLDWAGISAKIGSDCPLFLVDQPVVMEGRGDRISKLDKTLCDRISGHPLILFKPAFPVNTAEAYARLAELHLYQPDHIPGQILAGWRDGNSLLPDRCNDFERLLCHWMPSIPIVLDRLRNHHGLDARLSGSGSACFVFPKDLDSAINILETELIDAWGSAYWMQQTCLK